jgi:hypothetical protein
MLFINVGTATWGLLNRIKSVRMCECVKVKTCESENAEPRRDFHTFFEQD